MLDEAVGGAGAVGTDDVDAGRHVGQADGGRCVVGCHALHAYALHVVDRQSLQT